MGETSRKSPAVNFVVTLLVLAFGLVFCAIAPARADEPDSDSLNQQALNTLALEGYCVTKVELGDDHSGALTSDGSLWLWGSGLYDQLGYEGADTYHSPGLGNKQYSRTPLKVPGLSEVTDFSLGFGHSAAITSDGALWTWGRNEDGELGYETAKKNQPTPRKVDGLPPVVDVSLGAFHTAAVDDNGNLWTWGLNNAGCLGYHDYGRSYEPKQVPELSDVVAVSLGVAHSAAVTGDGSLYTWGGNDDGELGYWTENVFTPHYSAESYTPKKVEGLPFVTDVSLGQRHSAVITSDGDVWSWGYNFYGELGDGTTESRYTPQQVPGLANVTDISLGSYFSAAVTSDGSLWTWGDNGGGQKLGDASAANRPTPKKVPSLSNVAAVSLGEDHGAALIEDGSLYTWGMNDLGCLGDATETSRPEPILVFEGSGEIGPPELPKAKFHLDRNSMTFTQSVDKQTFEPASDTITLRYSDCEPEPISDSRIDITIESSSPGKTVYRITPRSGYEYRSNINITFYGKSTVEGVADPSSARLVINFDDATATYLEDTVRQTQSTQYNPELAYLLAQLAASAGNKWDIEDRCTSMGFEVLEQDYANDFTTPYTLARKRLDDGSNMVLIVARGTDKDWTLATDATIGVTQVIWGWHVGFAESAKAVYTGIEEHTGSIDTRNTTYVVTGHSLGAATANLVSMKLSEAGVPNTKVYDYNFACPDVAKEPLPINFNPDGAHDNIFNIGSQYDPITFVPMALRIGPAALHWGKYGRSRWFDAGEAGKGKWGIDWVVAEHDAWNVYVKFLEKRVPFESLLTEDQMTNPSEMSRTYRWLGIHCPVDVAVYGESGELVASVVGGEVKLTDPDGAVLVASDGEKDGEKYVCLPVGTDYRVELTATGSNATMTYEVRQLNFRGPEGVTKTFEAVKLIEGKTMVSDLGGMAEPTDTKLYVVDATSGVPTREVKQDGTEVAATDVAIDMYRMYNPWTGEHLYTASATERDTMRGNGWDYEGVMWSAPRTSFTPIWRLYNPWSGDHHYARTQQEYDELQGQGWQGEGVVFYSAGTDGVPIYRLFNPYQMNVGTHHYTDKASERNTNVSQGWVYEEVGWYGLK